MRPFSLIIQAPAKINYALRILGVRKDNYCELRSLLLKTTLHDEVRVSFSRSSKMRVSLHCNIDPHYSDWVLSSLLPKQEDNLAYRAAVLFLQKCHLDAEVEIGIVKRIPIGGGLGGGSSDAAAVLLALQQLFEYPLSEAQLLALSLELGSDLPAFLHRGHLLVMGRGERTEPLSLQKGGFLGTPFADSGRDPGSWSKGEIPLVLHYPGFPISTAEIYDAYKKAASLTGVGAGDNYDRDKTRVQNDLEPLIVSRYPELSAIKKSLGEFGANAVGITGTGSSVFALFESLAQANAAAEATNSRCFALLPD
ncbi:MAG: hypothetical protein HY391_00590 [Deltaproteobacteria bacterium]|nr:hypothetical protein [Deltaproteobacteria bacterium]